MYICVCNEITDQDLKNNPELISACGTECGTCIEFISLMKGTENRADAGSIPAASTRSALKNIERFKVDPRCAQKTFKALHDGGDLDSTDDI